MREFYEDSLSVFRPFAPLLFILHNPPADPGIGGDLQGVDVPACSTVCVLNQLPDFFGERKEVHPFEQARNYMWRLAGACDNSPGRSWMKTVLS